MLTMTEEELITAYEDAKLAGDEDEMIAIASELYEKYGRIAR